MYNRISRKTFDRYIERLSKEKRLTKNQLEWEYQRYLLNNRLAAAEKRGFVIDADVIPSRPNRVTKSDLQRLSKIKGDVAIFDVSDYVDTEKLSTKTIEKIVKKHSEKGDVTFAQNESGHVRLYNINNATKDEYPELETWADNKSNGDDFGDHVIPPSQEDDYASDYYNGSDREWAGDDETLEDVDYAILNNVLESIANAPLRNDADKKLFGDNKEIKDNATRQAFHYVNGAIREYGRDETARRLQNSAEDVSELVIAILHWYYIGKSELTQERTDSRLHILSEILFSNDNATSMKYDFSEDEV